MRSSIIENEFNEIENKNCWINVFQTIKEKSEKDAKEKHFTLIESKQIKNRNLNRYRDVNPYDHSRIILSRGDTDYINANLVKLDRVQRKYILTQGPLQQTISHFWLMIWEQNSKAILMLNKLIEKKQIKCHKYWPNGTGEANIINLEDVGLSIECLKVEEYVNFSKRTLKLTDTNLNDSREIIQFHYTTWPDFGIPTSPVAFLQFLEEVRNSGVLKPDVGPPIVHCSAGIGRSGTFCLVDCCLALIENEGEDKVNVQDILMELRSYRMGLIQTVDQLYFSYQAIIEGIKKINNPDYVNNYEEVPVTPTYEDELEDSAPPLPPPRTYSLNHVGNKPLPSIPNSESLSEDISSLGADLLNHNINKDDHYNEPNLNRPLPPIPKENSLEKLDEYINNDEKHVNNNESESGSDESIMEYVNESDSSDEFEYDDRSSEVTSSNPSQQKLVKNHVDSNENDSMKNDSQANASENEQHTVSPSELRRRKRLERNNLLEEKIQQIKQKQKLTEYSKETPKNSKLIKITAGALLIGVICGVIVYIKFG